jgi:hypothetical protein
MLSIRATNCAKEATGALQFDVNNLNGSILVISQVSILIVLHCECEYRQVRSATRRLPICLWYRSLFALAYRLRPNLLIGIK